MRKDNFKVRSHREIELSGKKGGLENASRTTERSQDGKDGLLGGLIFTHAFMNWMIKGCKAHLVPVLADRAEICTFRVPEFSPLSIPVCRNSRIW